MIKELEGKLKELQGKRADLAKQKEGAKNALAELEIKMGEDVLNGQAVTSAEHANITTNIAALDNAIKLLDPQITDLKEKINIAAENEKGELGQRRIDQAEKLFYEAALDFKGGIEKLKTISDLRAEAWRAGQTSGSKIISNSIAADLVDGMLKVVDRMAPYDEDVRMLSVDLREKRRMVGRIK